MILEDKLKKARIDILLNSPFLAKALYSLELKPINSTLIPTAATDGYTIWYNPQFFDDLTLGELKGVWVHEIMHVLCGHHLRMQDRNPKKWNHACDYAINPLVQDAGYMLPEDLLLDPNFFGKSAEEIFNIIPDLENDDTSKWGDVIGTKSGDLSRAQDDWKSLVASTKWGKCPSDVTRQIDEFFKPKVSIAEQLAEFFNQIYPDDYSFMPPKQYGNILLPKLSGKLGNIVIAIDTSGSIQDFDLKGFLAIIQSVVPFATIDIIVADAEIKGIIYDIKDINSVNKGLKGGGGTDFRPAITWAENHEYDVILYLTDGYGDYPSDPPQIPLIWGIISDYTPPWGVVIKL